MTATPAHGDRRRYRAGCRCLRCRAGYAVYQARHRAGLTRRELIDAAPARARLCELQAQGIGSRQAAKLAGLSRTLVLAIREDRAVRIQPDTAARILAIRPVLAPGQRIAGTRTWRWIDSLLREGLSKRDIAWRLGLRSWSLQFHRAVTVRTATRVKQLHRALAEENP